MSGKQDEPASIQQLERKVELAKAGDEGAFGDLYKEFSAKIGRLLNGLLRNEETAKDFTQETFLQAWRRLSELREVYNFEHWLCKIAINLALDYIRKERKKQTCYLDQDLVDKADPGEYIPTNELFKRTLADLTNTKERECYLLHNEGFSNVEIAEILDLKVSCVPTYISNVRKKLREAYNRSQQEPHDNAKGR